MGYPDHGRVAGLVRLFEKGSPVGSEGGSDHSGQGGRVSRDHSGEWPAAGSLSPKPIFAASPGRLTAFAEPSSQVHLLHSHSPSTEGVPRHPSRFSLDEDRRHINPSRLHQSSGAPGSEGMGPRGSGSATAQLTDQWSLEGQVIEMRSMLQQRLSGVQQQQQQQERRTDLDHVRSGPRRWFSFSGASGGAPATGRRSSAGSGKVVPVMSNGSRCSPIRGSELSSVSPGLGLGASRRFLHLFDDGEAITPSRVSQPSLHAAIGPRASGSGLQEGSLGAFFSPPAARKWGSFSGAIGQQSVHPRGQHQQQRPWNGSMDGSSSSAIAPRPSAFGNAASIGGRSGTASPLRLTLSPRGSLSGGDRASFTYKVHPDPLALLAENPMFQDQS